MKILISLSILLSSTLLFANSNIEVKNAHIRLPPPGSTTAVMFLDITNKDKMDKFLLGIKGSISDDFELHEMAMAGGQMTMRKVEKILLKNKTTTTLKPGGLHVMIFKLKAVLKEKEEVSLDLLLDQGEHFLVKAIVQKDI